MYSDNIIHSHGIIKSYEREGGATTVVGTSIQVLWSGKRNRGNVNYYRTVVVFFCCCFYYSIVVITVVVFFDVVSVLLLLSMMMIRFCFFFRSAVVRSRCWFFILLLLLLLLGGLRLPTIILYYHTISYRYEYSVKGESSHIHPTLNKSTVINLLQNIKVKYNVKHLYLCIYDTI